MFFSKIEGHEREAAVLARAASSGRVAHAYLFAGPEGVGKRLTAVSFAAYLNCEARLSGGGLVEACGECDSCQAFSRGVSTNLLEVAPEDGLIRIDRIRELQGALRRKASRGVKVAVVDGAEKLMPAAANAFLKTLEEPPGDSVIVLVTSRASELLPTVLSRCQRVNFRPLPDELVSRMVEEKKGLDAESARVVARLAGGSVSRALEYVDAEVHSSRDELLGRIAAISGRDSFSLMKAAYELSKRDDLEEVLVLLKTWFRDRAVAASGRADLAVNPASLGPAGSGGGVDELCRSFALVEGSIRDITPPRYGNKRMTMETLLMGLAELGVLAR